jgi:hypothetical protein
MVVLHPKFVDEIKNHPDLSFEDSIKKAGYETGNNDAYREPGSNWSALSPQ